MRDESPPYWLRNVIKRGADDGFSDYADHEKIALSVWMAFQENVGDEFEWRDTALRLAVKVVPARACASEELPDRILDAAKQFMGWLESGETRRTGAGGSVEPPPVNTEGP